MNNKVMYYTQEVLFHTEHYGKPYFWLKDVDGHVYMVRATETANGLVPDLT